MNVSPSANTVSVLSWETALNGPFYPHMENGELSPNIMCISVCCVTSRCSGLHCLQTVYASKAAGSPRLQWMTFIEWIICSSFVLFEQCSPLSVTSSDLLPSLTLPPLPAGHRPRPSPGTVIYMSIKMAKLKRRKEVVALFSGCHSSDVSQLTSPRLQTVDLKGRREYWCIAVSCMRRMGGRGEWVS